MIRSWFSRANGVGVGLLTGVAVGVRVDVSVIRAVEAFARPRRMLIITSIQINTPTSAAPRMTRLTRLAGGAASTTGRASLWLARSRVLDATLAQARSPAGTSALC